jgi:hypothetical protein
MRAPSTLRIHEWNACLAISIWGELLAGAGWIATKFTLVIHVEVLLGIQESGARTHSGIVLKRTDFSGVGIFVSDLRAFKNEISLSRGYDERASAA